MTDRAQILTGRCPWCKDPLRVRLTVQPSRRADQHGRTLIYPQTAAMVHHCPIAPIAPQETK